MRAARDSGTRVTWAIVGCQQGNTILRVFSALAARDSFHNPGFERKEKLNLKDLSMEQYNPEISTLNVKTV